MEYKTTTCLNTTKLLGFHMLLKQVSPFHSRPHYVMRSFILWQRKNWHLV